MKFSKVRDVKSIERGTKGSAGLDFFVPTANILFLNDFEKQNPKVRYFKENNVYNFEVRAHESVLIPSGIKVNVPEGKVLIGFNKSGVAVKKHLTLGAKVIDSDYQGEIFINLVNLSDKAVIFAENEKIAQFLLLDAWHGNPELVEIENLYKDSISERGEGCLGSTNIEGKNVN